MTEWRPFEQPQLPAGCRLVSDPIAAPPGAFARFRVPALDEAGEPIRRRDGTIAESIDHEAVIMWALVEHEEVLPDDPQDPLPGGARRVRRELVFCPIAWRSTYASYCLFDRDFVGLVGPSYE